VNRAERIRRFDDYLAQQRGRLVAIARVYAGNDSEDLLQEILLQIWKSLDQFRDLARLDTWAYRIAINTSLQWRRSASRKRKHLPPENVDITSIGHRGADVDPAELLDQFLTTLAGSDKAVLVMYLDGLSNSDMADVLGVAESAVRVRLHRIKTKLSDWSGEQR
jgi:RNA polymerase sigma-70 factor, ECF subfamily